MLTKAHLQALKWATERAAEWRGSLTGHPDEEVLAEFDQNVTSCKAALTAVRQELKKPVKKVWTTADFLAGKDPDIGATILTFLGEVEFLGRGRHSGDFYIRTGNGLCDSVPYKDAHPVDKHTEQASWSARAQAIFNLHGWGGVHTALLDGTLSVGEKK